MKGKMKNFMEHSQIPTSSDTSYAAVTLFLYWPFWTNRVLEASAKMTVKVIIRN